MSTPTTPTGFQPSNYGTDAQERAPLVASGRRPTASAAVPPGVSPTLWQLSREIRQGEGRVLRGSSSNGNAVGISNYREVTRVNRRTGQLETGQQRLTDPSVSFERIRAGSRRQNHGICDWICNIPRAVKIYLRRAGWL